ncbi:NACHT domain-containing protein [Streptomyces sp. NPDC057877]|uniref:NACHT domain-containing protein n=1 Tax=Streptomyces sp. NPDC057877 TaxID=3346269 RepID=UPI00367CDEF9
MTGGRALDRAVVVQGEGGQGSGVLLDGYVVLTARHVVGDGDTAQVVHPSSSTPTNCSVAWSDPELDAALLVSDATIVSAERAAPWGATRYGRLATLDPLPHCQIVGFPHVQRYGPQGEDLEYDQYRATVLPMAGRVRATLVCELDRPPVADWRWRSSPLRGLSGAPVFAGAVLVGIVTEVPKGRGHRRIEAVPVKTAMRRAQSTFTWPEKHFEAITDAHPGDERFEDRYAADLKAQYRRTEIFGIDELGRSESRWDLDTAYLSLEAAAREEPYTPQRFPGPSSSTSPQRVDALLGDRPRALLRGEAGAGKTTLVWWLAAHAANGTLGSQLRELNGMVPFVVPLRAVHARGGRFPTVTELLSAGRVLTDDAPEGWTRRVLEAGRGLLLVDGLDEVPEREREEARRWLTALLDRYPRTRCLATVRPNAVAKDWLAQDGFTELTLLPLSDDDINTFVAAWHEAARLECEHVYPAGRAVEERRLLSELEESLCHQLDQSPALRTLARTPLLCAVICALHRRRGGLLPTTRWSLYRAALAMLLGGRDAGRGVRPADVTLDSDEQHALLQRLAIWLVRTGQQQMTRDQAVQQLNLALRDMPQIQAQATAERVLGFLVDRSGLLQERADDAIQFIHRTFQDYLAAKEFHESGYILELLKHVTNEEWSDVFVLGVGHATRKDAHDLIERLINLGDKAAYRDRRWYLHMLAARCASSLLTLDAGLSQRVRDGIRRLMPPRDGRESMELGKLGDWFVDLLPEAVSLDEVRAYHVVRALIQVRSARARRALRPFAAHPAEGVRDCVVSGWDTQPVDEYAREVLYGMDAPHVVVSSPARLAHVSRFGAVRSVAVFGAYSDKQLDAALPKKGLRHIEIHSGYALKGLDFVRARVDLASLALLSLMRTRDVPEILMACSAAGRIGRLTLHVERLAALSSPEPLPHVRALKLLVLNDYADVQSIRLTFPGLTRLDLTLWHVDGRPLDLTPLRDIPDLEIGLTCDDRLRVIGAEDFGQRLNRERFPVTPARMPGET